MEKPYELLENPHKKKNYMDNQQPNLKLFKEGPTTIESVINKKCIDE